MARKGSNVLADETVRRKTSKGDNLERKTKGHGRNHHLRQCYSTHSGDRLNL